MGCRKETISMDRREAFFPFPLDAPPRLLDIGRDHAPPRNPKQTMASLIQRRGNATLVRFQVPFWSMHLYMYEASVEMEGDLYPIEPGCVSLIPPGRAYEFRYEGEGIHFFAHLLPEGPVPGRPVAVFQNMGLDFPHIKKQFEDAVDCFSEHPSRSEAKIWDILWEAKVWGERRVGEKGHPALEWVVKKVETAMGEHLKGGDLARQAGISLRQLDRLFKARFGKTVAKYITARRMARAKHLILHSSRPVKWIAVEVGIPNLQMFNKTFRREFGVSPRKMREQS